MEGGGFKEFFEQYRANEERRAREEARREELRQQEIADLRAQLARLSTEGRAHVSMQARRVIKRDELEIPIDDGGEEDVDYRRHKKDDYDKIKLDLPEFAGGSNPDDFIEWIHAMERIFEYHEFSEEKKCKVAVLKFKKYASIWYENLKQQRLRDGKEKIRTWEKLKTKMEKRFLPRNYKRDLFWKMTIFRQGALSVNDYIQEFEQLLMKSGVPEPPEQTMARFVGGLNREIADVVNLQPYNNFEEVCQLAQQVEKQQKTKKTPFKSFGSSTYTKGGSSSMSKTEAISYKDKGKGMEIAKGIPKKLEPKKCFKCHGYGHMQAECPTKQAMTILDVAEIERELLTTQYGGIEVEDDVESETEANEESVIEDADVGENLVIRRVLHAEPSKTDEEQRENIFHTRCTIGGKVCTMIIDSGSCTNVASTLLVEKLKLPTKSHPKPYKLQWLKEGSDLKVTKQVLVSLSIGNNYKDEVLCDVIPMDACHILLGRPWQFDKKAIHDGTKNTYSFHHAKKHITLAPLLPNHIRNTKPGEGSKENLFLSETRVKKALQENEPVFALLVAESNASESDACVGE